MILARHPLLSPFPYRVRDVVLLGRLPHRLTNGRRVCVPAALSPAV